MQFVTRSWLLAFASCLCVAQNNSTTTIPSAPIQQSVPRLIKISGALTNSNATPRIGTVGLTFAIYKDAEGGPALWQEVQNVIPDSRGRYSVLLGSTSPEGLPLELFVSGDARWLGIRVEQDAELPRTLLVSVPYALKAGDAETLGGKPASSFVTAEQLSSSLSSPNAGSQKVQTSIVSGGTPLAANVTGSGSQNVVPKFDSSGTNLVNSLLFDDGTHIGLGTQSPTFQFDEQNSDTSAAAANMFRIQTPSVNGATMHFISTSPNGRHFGFGSNFILGNGEFGIYDYTANANRFLIAANGNIGIGTNTPQFNFDLQNADATAAGSNIFRLRTPSVNGAVMHFQSTSANGHDWAFGSNFVLGAGEFGVYDYTANASRLFITGAGNIGIGTTSPSSPLDVNGVIRTTGGFKFPDGTIQMSAATTCTSNCGGTISGVTAGAGLIGGGTTGTVTLNLATPVAIANGGTGLSLAGNAGTYLRSNGNALQSSTIQVVDLPANIAFTNANNNFNNSQTISGNLTIQGVNGGTITALAGVFQGATGGVVGHDTVTGMVADVGGVQGTIDNAQGGGVIGRATSASGVGGATPYGVWGVSRAPTSNAAISSGTGVFGQYGVNADGSLNTNATQGFGVRGLNSANNTSGGPPIGVRGEATGTGFVIGVSGFTSSPSGIAVDGLANAAGGIAVRGLTQNSIAPTAVFDNQAGGKIASFQKNAVEQASIDGNGNLVFSGTITGNGSGLTNVTPTGGSSNYVQNGTTPQAANFNIIGNGVFGGSVGVGTSNPGQKLSVVGTIESTAGGFKFPDGSVQTAAVSTALRTRELAYLAGCDSCSPLTTADSQANIFVNLIGSITITSVQCFTDAGTAHINLNLGGGNFLNPDLVCTVGGASSGAISKASVANDKLNFVLTQADGVAHRTTVAIMAVVN